ncbi:MAG: hypothetical protein KF690_03925 [Bacteroidetes bacterium]|nr:hypothetical protein [Bacteroidota bacterium]
MTFSELKAKLEHLESLRFILPNGTIVPACFHVTEIGEVSKRFMDCGNVLREQKTVSMQLWVANDTEHRLAPAKLLRILQQSEKALGIGDHEVVVEYQTQQTQVLGKYSLDFNGLDFTLIPQQAACLAPAQCGVSPEKKRISLATLKALKEGGCCA